ncbi:MAG: peptide deformylase [Rhodospirillales bacterium]|nr:peptide deformylase [Rhodospirillales bacterium]
MAILKIARMGHPILFGRAESVELPRSAEIRRLVSDMIETMLDANGAGLAAPQVHVPLRLFVFRVPPERAGSGPEERPVPVTVVINPQIEFLGEERVLRWEGCLSIPGLRAAVPRHARIRYVGIDCEDQPIGAVASGFHAGVVQHEYDHLDGILYPMRMQDFSRFGFTEELARVGAMEGAG